MKQYYLKISSKNEKSLRNFLIFFLKHLKTEFNIIQKSGQANNKKKVITLLKSPHVNKAAQEHFEFHTFSKQLLIKSFSLNKNFIFIKKIMNQLFQDLSIKLKFISKSSSKTQNRLSVFNLDNFELHTTKLQHKNVKRSKQKVFSKSSFLTKNALARLSKFLNKTSIFGEILIFYFSKTTKSLNSSAVEQRTENPCVGSSILSSDKISYL